ALFVLVLGKGLDGVFVVFNATAAGVFFFFLVDPTSIEDSSFQMTFAAVLAVIGIRVPASQWALGWLREGLKDFRDVSKDSDLSARASDWRGARRGWCERERAT